jgi:hypothetical protein
MQTVEPQAPKIIRVEVPVANSLPVSSAVRRASAVAWRRPRWTTVP